MNGPLSGVDIEQFGIIPVSARTILTQCGLMVSTNARLYVDKRIEELAMEMRSMLAGRMEERIDIEEKWPSDWWQAFKDRWFPKWALRRWPVHYLFVSCHKQIWRVCPHINIKFCEDQRHFEWLRTGKPSS